MNEVVLWRRLLAELLGSAFLVIGGVLAVGAIRALYPGVTPAQAADIIVPHHLDRPGAGNQAGVSGQ